MKIIRATPALKELAGDLPLDFLAEESDVQVGSEDTPAEIAALLKIEGDRKGKNCAVMFDDLGVTFCSSWGHWWRPSPGWQTCVNPKGTDENEL